MPWEVIEYVDERLRCADSVTFNPDGSVHLTIPEGYPHIGRSVTISSPCWGYYKWCKRRERVAG